ncbi:MAG: hypothetical protein JWO80_5517 [Bryobacterales bacterium]|nr:hypothetical protein [Bryobacterales bacterium]
MLGANERARCSCLATDGAIAFVRGAGVHDQIALLRFQDGPEEQVAVMRISNDGWLSAATRLAARKVRQQFQCFSLKLILIRNRENRIVRTTPSRPSARS